MGLVGEVGAVAQVAVEEAGGDKGTRSSIGGNGVDGPTELASSCRLDSHRPREFASDNKEVFVVEHWALIGERVLAQLDGVVPPFKGGAAKPFLRSRSTTRGGLGGSAHVGLMSVEIASGVFLVENESVDVDL